MSPIRVANAAELPPGKGKIVELGSKRVTVYNSEGRYYATCASWPRVQVDAHTATTGACMPRGFVFEACAEDSPARLDADGKSYLVHVEGEVVWLDLG